MTLEQFIEKYTGKKVEYHSYSSNSLFQCADLANQYIVEVLGLPAIIGTNAQDFPKKAGNKYDYIINTPTGQPSPGDIMIFKSADGVGHISVHVKNISLSLFTSFDQNYPTGSPCKLVNHNYTNVLGWLRKKGESQPPVNLDPMQEKILKKYNVKDESELDKKIEEHVGTSWGGESNGGYLGSARKENRDLKAQVDGLTQNASDLRESHSAFVRRIIDKTNPFLGLPNASDEERAVDAVERIISENSSLVSELKNSQKAFSEREKNLLDENRTLHSELDKLQDEIDAMKVKHSDDILQLEKKLENAKQSIDTHNEQKDDFEVLKQLWDKIISIFQKGKDEKVKKVSAKRGRPKKVA